MKMENLFGKLRSRIKVLLYSLRYRGCFQASVHQRAWGTGLKIHIEKAGKLTVGSGLWVRDHVRIDCASGAVLQVGEKVFLNNGVYISARDSITLGESTIVGPNTVIVDHDHNFRSDAPSFLSDSITIGKHVWIGANAVILRGSVIGDRAVIGAGCVVKGKVPPYSVVTGQRPYTVRSYHPET